MATMINCPICGKLTDPNLDSCVHCGGLMKKAADEGAPSPPKKSQTCPNCGALVQSGDIICVACGTNLLTGQRLTQKEPKRAAEPKDRLPLIVGAAAVGGLILVVLLVVLLTGRDPVTKAKRLWEEGQKIEAVDLLERHLEKKPDDAEATFVLGAFRLESGESEEAASAFERVATLDQENREAAVLAAIAYADLPDDRGLPQAIASLERQVKRFPDDEKSLHFLAQAKGATGDLSGQIQALEKLVGLKPTDVQARVDLAIARALAGDLTASSSDLAAARKLSENDPGLPAATGALAALQGLPDDALAQLQAAGDEASLAVLNGALLLASGETDEAADCLAKAGNSPAARFFRAACLDAQGLGRDALQEFRAIADQGGEYAAEAAVQLARAYLNMGDLAPAFEASDMAVRLGATGPVIHTVRGRIFTAQENPERALEAFREAIHIDPKYAPAHLELGLLYVQRSRVSQGIEELKTYLECVDPTLRDAHTSEIKSLVEQLEATT